MDLEKYQANIKLCKEYFDEFQLPKAINALREAFNSFKDIKENYCNEAENIYIKSIKIFLKSQKESEYYSIKLQRIYTYYENAEVYKKHHDLIKELDEYCKQWSFTLSLINNVKYKLNDDDFMSKL